MTKCNLKFWKKRRLVVTLVMFLVFFNSHALSTNLNVVIVAITSTHSYTYKNDTYKLQEFDWDSNFRALALGSYFYGSVGTFIFGGWIAPRLGGSTLLTISAFTSSALTVALPELIKFDKYLLVLLRVGLGCCLGVVLPSVDVLWSKWAPVDERATLSSFALAGSYIGRVYASLVSGTISHYCGWPAVFYITGFFSFLLGIICGKIVKNEPSKDERISEEELNYISESIGTYSNENKVPWMDLLKSMPLWAIIVAHFTANWSLLTLSMELPTFMHGIYFYNLNTIGLLSALSYLLNAITLQFSGQLADRVYRSGTLSKTNVRKLFICSTFLIQMIFIDLAVLLQNSVVVATCFIIIMGLDSFVWSNLSVNHLDIGTQFAGVLMGISCTFSAVPGIVGPLIFGAIVRDKTSCFQWQCAFILIGFFYFFGAIFYGIFGSAELQYWARTKKISL